MIKIVCNYHVPEAQQKRSVSILGDAENPGTFGFVDVLECKIVEAYVEASSKVVVHDVFVATEQFYLR